MKKCLRWRSWLLGVTVSATLALTAPVNAATTGSRITPYTGAYLQGDWSWQPKDNNTVLVWPTGENSSSSNSKSIPWWNLFLLQQSGQNMGTLVQYILNYMGQIKLKEAEQQAVIAPSTAIENGVGASLVAARQAVQVVAASNVSGRTIVTMPPNKNVNNLPLTLNNTFAIHQQFCSLSDAKSGICAPSVVNTVNPNADLTASSLISTDVLGTQAAQVAAKAFLQQLFAPKIVQAPLQLMENGQLKPEAVNRLKMQWSALARQSLGETIMHRMLEERMPVKGLWMPGANSGPDISLKQFMRHEAAWRFESQTWKNQVNTAPTNALLRELVNMEAYRMYLEYQQNQKLDDLAALLSVMAAGSSNTGVNDVMKSISSQANAVAVHTQ